MLGTKDGGKARAVEVVVHQHRADEQADVATTVDDEGAQGVAHGEGALVEEGGTILLAGLLKEQADAVLSAYRAQGMRLAERMDNGDWPTLRLRKRPRIGWKRPTRLDKQPRGDAPGYGSL